MNKMTVPEVCQLIEKELARYSGTDCSALEEIRSKRLLQLGEFLRAFGFPQTKRERFENSLHPYFFQEAIYDDLDPWTRHGNLGQLRGLYAIDLAVQTGGGRRDSIAEGEFQRYVSELGRIVAWRQERAGLLERALLWISSSRVPSPNVS